MGVRDLSYHAFFFRFWVLFVFLHSLYWLLYFYFIVLFAISSMNIYIALLSLKYISSGEGNIWGDGIHFARIFLAQKPLKNIIGEKMVPNWVRIWFSITNLRKYQWTYSTKSLTRVRVCILALRLTHFTTLLVSTLVILKLFQFQHT